MRIDEVVNDLVWSRADGLVSLILGWLPLIPTLLIVYGGFLYVVSAGDPGKASRGKKVIINAMVGFIFCMAASAIGGFLFGLASGGVEAGLSSLISMFTTWTFVFSLLMFVYAGLLYVWSAGDPGKAQLSKKVIIYACIGIIIVVAAELLKGWALRIASSL